MATPSKGKDRRSQRTRQMLRQAFIEVVQDKGFAGASIQKITERANVSRGTFYAHYEDKYALVDSIIREEFQQAINDLPAEWNRKSLRRFIQAVLDYFKAIVQHFHGSRDVASLLEQALHEELTRFVLAMLKQAPEVRSHISLEAIAQIISWAIFGAAIQWTQEKTAISSEKVVDEIVRMIMGGVTQFAPESLPN